MGSDELGSVATDVVSANTMAAGGFEKAVSIAKDRLELLASVDGAGSKELKQCRPSHSFAVVVCPGLFRCSSNYLMRLV